MLLTPEHQKYIKQILTGLMGEIDSNTIVLGDFNTSLSARDRSLRQKINMKTLTTNRLKRHRTLPLKNENTFLSAHGLFSRVDHVIGHNITTSKFKTTEIITTVFSDHNEYEENQQEESENIHRNVKTKHHTLKKSLKPKKTKGNKKLSSNKNENNVSCEMQQNQY